MLVSTNVGEIDLSLILNSKQFKSQVKDIVGQTDKASSQISVPLAKIGKMVAAAFSVTAVVKFGKECLNVATEASNAWIGLNSILVGQGKSFDKAKSFINEYISDGLVPLNNAVASYKNLALRGYSSEQIEKTMNALKNSATFARQSTYSLGDAVQTATEGLKNENSVVVDNAGVTKNVAKMWEDYAAKIGKTTNNLTQAEKIQAEVNGILEETKFQSNDAAIYTSTYSGKVAQLSSAFTNMKIAIGNVIQPIAKLFIPIITSAVNVVTKLFTALSGLLALFGLKADSVETVSSGIGDLADQANGASDAISGVGDSAKKAGKDAKKASNNLAAFDNLNVLQKDTDTSSGSSGGAGGSYAGLTDTLDVSSTVTEDTSAFDGLISRVKELANIFKEGFDASFGDTNFDGIFNHLFNIKNAIIDIWTDPDVLSSMSQWVDTLLYSFGQITGAVARIGVNVAEFFVGSIDKYLSQNTDRIKLFICNMFDISSESMALSGNFAQVLGEISDVFSGDTAKQIGADIIAMFANPFMAVKELTAKFALDLKGILLQPIIDNAEGIKTAIENTLGPIQTITGTLAESFTSLGDTMNQVYDEHIGPMLDSFKTGISDSLGHFIELYNTYLAPILQEMADKFTEVWVESIQPMVTGIIEFVGSLADLITLFWETILQPLVNWIIENIVPQIMNVIQTIYNGFMNFVSNISKLVTSLLKIIKGIIDFVVGVFTGDWQRAWDGIKNIFSGFFDSIKNILNLLKDTFTDTFNGIWSVVKGVCNSILGRN